MSRPNKLPLIPLSRQIKSKFYQLFKHLLFTACSWSYSSSRCSGCPPLQEKSLLSFLILWTLNHAHCSLSHFFFFLRLALWIDGKKQTLICIYRVRPKIFNCIYSTSHCVLTEIMSSLCNDLGNVPHTCQPAALHREALMKPDLVVMIEIPSSDPLYVGMLTIEVDSFLYYLLIQTFKR